MSIIGIEGNSFSGKSELSRLLSLDGYSIVEEPSYYVDSFPPPPYNLDSAKKNLLFFSDVEKARSEDALEQVASGRNVVMDRTLWTYILYEYVLLKRFPEKPNVFYYSLDLFEKLSENKDIVIPNILLCLTPGSDSVLRQRILQRRPTGIDFLNEWETTQLIGSALEEIIGVYGPENSMKIINNETTEYLVSSGKIFLDNVSPKDLQTTEIFEVLRNIVDI